VHYPNLQYKAQLSLAQESVHIAYPESFYPEDVVIITLSHP